MPKTKSPRIRAAAAPAHLPWEEIEVSLGSSSATDYSYALGQVEVAMDCLIVGERKRRQAEWWRREAEADADIRAGRVRRFMSDEEFLDSLR